MQRALELAMRGTGCTSPNPLVGCVVVVDENIVGEGWHEYYGHHHAEVNAINDARKTYQTRGLPSTDHFLKHSNATLYITLEPCHHHGLTPPCTKAIVDAGISHVVYALDDPNPKAAGGADWLTQRGVRMTRSILEHHAAFQNRFFLTYIESKKPYVIAKTAMSLDGKIATYTGHSQWITGPESRQKAHQLRQSVDAIMVGVNTVIADDPSLTVRLPEELLSAHLVRHPRPIILDSNARAPLTAQLINGTLPTRCLVLTSHNMPAEHRRAIESQGGEVVIVRHNEKGPGLCPHAIIDTLGQQGLTSVLLEGGAQVQGTFRDADLIDEVWTFIAPMIMGGANAAMAYQGVGAAQLENATQLEQLQIEALGSDILVKGLVSKKGITANKLLTKQHINTSSEASIGQLDDTEETA